MYYDIKKMCRKSSPAGEGSGEGPVVIERGASCCGGGAAHSFIFIDRMTE